MALELQNSASFFWFTAFLFPVSSPFIYTVNVILTELQSSTDEKIFHLENV
jgi:hypothetical protein